MYGPLAEANFDCVFLDLVFMPAGAVNANKPDQSVTVRHASSPMTMQAHALWKTRYSKSFSN
jgi:hypothetical protein